MGEEREATRSAIDNVRSGQADGYNKYPHTHQQLKMTRMQQIWKWSKASHADNGQMNCTYDKVTAELGSRMTTVGVALRSTTRKAAVLSLHVALKST